MLLRASKVKTGDLITIKMKPISGVVSSSEAFFMLASEELFVPRIADSPRAFLNIGRIVGFHSVADWDTEVPAVVLGGLDPFVTMKRVLFNAKKLAFSGKAIDWSQFSFRNALNGIISSTKPMKENIIAIERALSIVPNNIDEALELMNLGKLNVENDAGLFLDKRTMLTSIIASAAMTLPTILCALPHNCTMFSLTCFDFASTHNA